MLTQTPTESVTAAARRPQLGVSVQPPNACHSLRGVWETTGPPCSQATVTGSPSVGKCTILWGGRGVPMLRSPPNTGSGGHWHPSFTSLPHYPANSCSGHADPTRSLHARPPSPGRKLSLSAQLTCP